MARTSHPRSDAVSLWPLASTVPRVNVWTVAGTAGACLVSLMVLLALLSTGLPTIVTPASARGTSRYGTCVFSLPLVAVRIPSIAWKLDWSSLSLEVPILSTLVDRYTCALLLAPGPMVRVDGLTVTVAASELADAWVVSR